MENDSATIQPSEPPNISMSSEPNPSAPLQPPTPISPIEKHPGKKWTVFFIFQSILSLITMVLPLIVLVWLVGQANSGVSGTEFVALLLLPFIYIGFFVAVINLITISYYIRKYKPKGRWLITGVISLSFSVLFATYSGFQLYQGVQIPGKIKQYQEQNAQNIKQLEAQYAPKEITIAQAIDLINGCKIHQFYYKPIETMTSEDQVAQTSASGVVLVTLPDEGPWRITVSAKSEAQLLPLAQASQKKCSNNLFIQ